MHASNRLVPSLALAAAAILAGVLAPASSAAPPVARAAKSGAAVASTAQPVDINTAGSADLQAIPGIGKALADRIIAFREKNGAFGSVDDLLKIQGIGEKSLQKIRPYVIVPKAK